MHEFGLFKLLVPSLEKFINDNNINRVTFLKLKIGEMKGINPEHIEHAFEHFKEDYPKFNNCKFEYEIISVTFKCVKCGEVFPKDSITCPKCNSGFPEFFSGDEFEIEDIKFER